MTLSNLEVLFFSGCCTFGFEFKTEDYIRSMKRINSEDKKPKGFTKKLSWLHIATQQISLDINMQLQNDSTV